ncbi:hypothetical protein PUN4_540005 [Paraburkholderia unamae]|nr:hypothetical protein PUN4_540005 [Paraburkholderia unamae]
MLAVGVGHIDFVALRLKCTSQIHAGGGFANPTLLVRYGYHESHSILHAMFNGGSPPGALSTWRLQQVIRESNGYLK